MIEEIKINWKKPTINQHYAKEPKSSSINCLNINIILNFSSQKMKVNYSFTFKNVKMI